jgi:hypothetical protein
VRQWCSNKFPEAKEQLENMYREVILLDFFQHACSYTCKWLLVNPPLPVAFPLDLKPTGGIFNYFGKKQGRTVISILPLLSSLFSPKTLAAPFLFSSLAQPPPHPPLPFFPSLHQPQPPSLLALSPSSHSPWGCVDHRSGLELV